MPGRKNDESAGRVILRPGLKNEGCFIDEVERLQPYLRSRPVLLMLL